MKKRNEDIPQHVAIIPDGNRRWARERGLKPWEGHSKSGSYENLYALFDEARKIGVKYLSFWGFSTENWKREKKEVDIIMRLILKGLNDFGDKANEEKIRFVHIGRKDRLLKKLVEKIEELENNTKKHSDFTVLLCLDYGGRDEIVRATNRILKSGRKEISEEEFLSSLDTAGFVSPELIIRTGGEKRMSGFMPFQSDYAELYFLEKYFPDFKAEDLHEAVEDFSKRKRRFGN